MKDFLYEYAHKMSSGNASVDQLNIARLGMQPEYWALIGYLSDKGLLDEREFADYLRRHFKAQLEAAERFEQDDAR